MNMDTGPPNLSLHQPAQNLNGTSNRSRDNGVNREGTSSLPGSYGPGVLRQRRQNCDRETQMLVIMELQEMYQKHFGECVALRQILENLLNGPVDVGLQNTDGDFRDMMTASSFDFRSLPQDSSSSHERCSGTDSITVPKLPWSSSQSNAAVSENQTSQAGTYEMLPNSTSMSGPTSLQTHQQPQRPQTNNPLARNPPRQWRMANVISSHHKRYLTNLHLNREIDRLASFCRWPTGRPNASPVALARAGFFYLGDMDRTQCFSCGGVLRHWTADDDVMAIHRACRPNCPFVTGVERRNVPVPEQAETPMELAEKYPCRFPRSPHMRSDQSRVATFDRRWPSVRTHATPQEMAEAGFFFLGERDRVKCWYCSGGLQNWEYDDVPWIEHTKWFPNCQFLLAKQGQLFVYRYLSLSSHLPRPIIGRQVGSRVDPSQATLHTGAGQSSGGQDVAPASAPISRVRAPSPPPVIIDPQVELHKRRVRVEKELKENDMVKVVLGMGFEEDLVRKALLDKLESGGAYDADSIYEGTAALLEAVMEKETEIRWEREKEQATSMKFPTILSSFYQVTEDDEDWDLYGSIGGRSSIAAPSSIGDKAKVSHIWKDIPEDQESLKEFIEQKKEERLCKICFTETADMVFIPCSHMVCCMSCTEAIRRCPICRNKVEKAIKTYVR